MPSSFASLASKDRFKCSLRTNLFFVYGYNINKLDPSISLSLDDVNIAKGRGSIVRQGRNALRRSTGRVEDMAKIVNRKKKWKVVVDGTDEGKKKNRYGLWDRDDQRPNRFGLQRPR